LRYLSDVLSPNVDLLYSNRHNMLEQLGKADVVIGAVLLTGAKAPKLVKRADLKAMKQGSVIVDVAVDQGGCIETTKPTTHDQPTYVVDGVIHYAVATCRAECAHLDAGVDKRDVSLCEAVGP